MTTNQGADSVGEVIHKKSKQKKLKTKGLSPIGQLDNRTIGSGYHTSQESIEQGSVGLKDNRQSKERTRTQRINAEIDAYLQQLLIEDLITKPFIPFYAKACHKLGVNEVNALAINSRNGNNPQKLFAYKVKGALTLHFKTEYERTQYEQI